MITMWNAKLVAKDRSDGCRCIQTGFSGVSGNIMLDHELMKSVAQQMMSGASVAVEGQATAVKHTSYQRLKTVTFQMNGREYQAIEQNAAKPSRWGELARQGHQVVQFREAQSGRYVAVAVDGEVKEYGTKSI
jgi:hypothetical protein